MKKFAIAAVFVAMIYLSGCNAASYYKGHPTTKQQLIDRMGPPWAVYSAEDGPEEWVYIFRGEGVTYMYYLIEDGMVVRTGMK